MTTKAVILIVDDIPSNIQTLAHLLKDDYIIKVANGGKSALEMAHQEPLPDLILLDVAMPDMNGYDVCKHLAAKADTAKIPVIFVTGKDTEEDEEYGLSLGAVDYITKPIRPSIVKARVKTHIALKRQGDLMRMMAVHDQLTGLYNRYYLTDALCSKISRSIRYKEPLSIVMLDIDHFKKINDTHGHLVGDSVLKAVSQALVAFARKEDIVARFGGEEFVIVLDTCTLEDALEKAERLRQSIESLNPENIPVSASFGVADLRRETNAEALLKAVDHALYRAKESGRNRVSIAEEREMP